MKKFALQTLLLITALTATLPCTAHDTNDNRRHISTNGYAEVKAKPDIAVVRMQVESTHKSGTTAKTEVDDRVNRFLAALKKLRIPEDNIVASNLRITPNFDYRDRQRFFTGYTASRNLEITLKDIEALNKLLDTALESGINQILNIGLEASREDKYRQQAREQAIADSKRKAAELAKAYGAELGAIYSISYQSTHPPASMEVQEGAMMLRASADADGRYIHDELTFTDNIQVDFDLIIPN